VKGDASRDCPARSEVARNASTKLDQLKVSQVSHNITSHLTKKKHHGTYCGRAFSSHIIRQRTCTDKGPRIVPLINHVLRDAPLDRESRQTTDTRPPRQVDGDVLAVGHSFEWTEGCVTKAVVTVLVNGSPLL
jgi:hypothetical protein